MTKQEVKDEHKESEGNPEAKAHIRGKQREMSRRAVRAAVMEAHVILTNPTHFAVALRYDRGQDEVPVVVAKGRGATALAIRELAAELDTPVLEYPQLARAVYYTSREGQEVRADLYQAIAVVLAFVFGLNAGRAVRRSRQSRCRWVPASTRTASSSHDAHRAPSFVASPKARRPAAVKQGKRAPEYRR